jgi:hypothetical protein
MRRRRLRKSTGELSAILGAAYDAFLHARIERRRGRRWKVYARDVATAVEMVAEMIAKAVGYEPEMLWQMAVAELDQDRGEIEADVLAHHGYVVVEHEWPLFVAWVERGAARKLCGGERIAIAFPDVRQDLVGSERGGPGVRAFCAQREHIGDSLRRWRN